MPPFDFTFCSEIILLGAVIGFLSGLFGVGGGFLLTPMLSIFGVPMHIAVGSSLCQMIGTGAAAGSRGAASRSPSCWRRPREPSTPTPR